jgi:hypothetical protein
MIQICQNLPLTAEAQQHRPALSEPALHRLDRHFFVVKIIGAGRQINLSHSTFPQQPQQLVSANAFSGELFLGGDLLRRLQHRLVEETHGLPRRMEQGFHFLAQFGITGAGFVEKRSAAVLLQFERRIEEVLDAEPTIGSRRGFHSRALLG